MNHPITNDLFRKYGFQVLLVFFASFILVLDWHLSEAQILPLLEDGKLSGAHSKAIDILLSRSSLFANWNIAVIGGTVFLLREEMKRRKLAAREITQVVTIFLISVFSLFLTQSLPDIIFRTLILEQDVLKHSGIFWYSRAIYISFFATLMVFASLFIDLIVRNDVDPDAKQEEQSP